MKKVVSCILLIAVQLFAVGLFFTTKFNTDFKVDKTSETVHNTNLDKIATSVTLLFKAENLVTAVEDEDFSLNELPSIEPVPVVEEEKKVETEVITESEVQSTPLVSVDATKYTPNPEMGFVVTENNHTYSLTDYEFNVVVAVVAGEFDKNLDDALAVVSVILNRSDSAKWYGAYSSPYVQVTHPGQFEVYFAGYYLSYMPGGSLYGGAKYQMAKQAVIDGLNGIRNNSYMGFRAWGLSGYSDKYIVYGGNRYAYN